MNIQRVVLLRTPDNVLFLSTFVEYSTDIIIAVMITAFLIHILVLAGQGAPIPFNTNFNKNRGLNNE